MNAIIIGNGSIGRRHFKNLRSLGLYVRAVDIDEIDEIDSILKNNHFDFGMVCTPNNLHLEHCLKLAEHGIHFFCEKPFYSEKACNILANIRKLVKEKSLVNMVGCNLRFHPTIKSFDKSEVSFVKAVFGYDLKKWHNDGKHLESYSANKNMGGGIMLDAIHEFDYLYNWFGEIEDIEVNCKKIGDVTIDTEDTVDATIKFKNGVIAAVQLDYLQPKYTRYVEKLVRDWGTEIHNIEPDDDMYIDEIKYFIDCVRNKRKCMNDIDEAVYLIDKLQNGIITNEL